MLLLHFFIAHWILLTARNFITSYWRIPKQVYVHLNTPFWRMNCQLCFWVIFHDQYNCVSRTNIKSHSRIHNTWKILTKLIFFSFKIEKAKSLTFVLPSKHTHHCNIDDVKYLLVHTLWHNYSTETIMFFYPCLDNVWLTQGERAIFTVFTWIL